jgi:WD40 repeat protein
MAGGRILTNSSYNDSKSTARLWTIPADGRSPTDVTSLRGYAYVLSDRFLMTYGEEWLLWDLQDPDHPSSAKLPYQPFSLPRDPDRRQLLSPDGRMIVVSGKSTKSEPMLWDISNPAKPVEAGTLAGTGEYELHALAFSPDSRRLAAADHYGNLVLWNVANPSSPIRLSAPISTDNSDGIATLMFSPDGESVLAGDQSGAFMLWDVADPHSPTRLAIPPIEAGTDLDLDSALRFSPDGNVVAIGPNLWNIEPLNRLRSQAVELGCARAGRGLNEAEWALYAPGTAYRHTCAPR